MEAKLQELKARLTEAYDLNMVNALLNWDHPPKCLRGAPARGRQMGLVAQLAHEKITVRRLVNCWTNTALRGKSALRFRRCQLIRVARPSLNVIRKCLQPSWRSCRPTGRKV